MCFIVPGITFVNVNANGKSYNLKKFEEFARAQNSLCIIRRTFNTAIKIN